MWDTFLKTVNFPKCASRRVALEVLEYEKGGNEEDDENLMYGENEDKTKTKFTSLL